MTAYAWIHYALAAYSGVMAVVHMVMWLFARSQRVQFWLSITFVGWVGVAIPLGVGSVAVDGVLTLPMWLILGGPGFLLVWLGLAMTVWRTAGRPLMGWRSLLLGVGCVLGIARTIDVALRISNASGPLTYEQATHTLQLPTTLPFWAMCFAVCGMWAVEAARVVHKKPLAWLLIAAAVPGSLFVVSDVLITFGLHIPDAPAMVGISGFIFAFFASLLVVTDYIRAIRRIERGDIDRYDLVRRIGAGGMGELFLALRRGPHGFERYVALKRVLRADGQTDPNWVERFLVEARVAAGLRHPNIVAVHDLGRFESGWFIAMEYLAGVSLSEIRKKLAADGTHIPVSVLAQIGERVCRGLDYAHGLGVVHRDISPQNVMVTFDGDVKVIDFGIAKAVGSTTDHAVSEDRVSTPDLTATGRVVGKLAYLSPERMRDKPIAPGSDLYATGLVLYELLCGQRPFDLKQKPADQLRAKEAGAFPAPIDARADVPSDLNTLLLLALAPQAKQRPTAAEMARELGAVHRAVPDVQLGEWIRHLFPDRAKEERALAAGTDADPTLQMAEDDRPSAPTLQPSVISAGNEAETVETPPHDPPIDEEKLPLDQ